MFFLGTLLKERLPINIGVLCDFLDFLCGSVILCGGRPIPHNVTVPRSWLLRFVKYDMPYFSRGIQRHCYLLLLEPMQDLLEQLHSQSCGKLQKFTSPSASRPHSGIQSISCTGTLTNLSNVPHRVRPCFYREDVSQLSNDPSLSLLMLLYQIEGCWLMSSFVYSVNCVLALFYDGCSGLQQLRTSVSVEISRS